MAYVRSHIQFTPMRWPIGLWQAQHSGPLFHMGIMYRHNDSVSNSITTGVCADLWVYCVMIYHHFHSESKARGAEIIGYLFTLYEESLEGLLLSLLPRRRLWGCWLPWQAGVHWSAGYCLSVWLQVRQFHQAPELVCHFLWSEHYNSIHVYLFNLLKILWCN